MARLNAAATAPAAAAAAKPAPSGSLVPQSDVISTLYPVVNGALQLQQLVGSAAFHLLVRTCFAASLVATASLWASKSIAWRALAAARALTAASLGLARRLVWAAWDSRRSRRLRKRLEFELFALLLGPSGNTLFLMLFWPGWPMLALLVWVFWQFAGSQ